MTKMPQTGEGGIGRVWGGRVFGGVRVDVIEELKFLGNSQKKKLGGGGGSGSAGGGGGGGGWVGGVRVDWGVGSEGGVGLVCGGVRVDVN